MFDWTSVVVAGRVNNVNPIYSSNNSGAVPFCNMASTADEGSEVVTVQEKQNAIENDLTSGILKLLKPAVEQVDRRVLDVRYICQLNYSILLTDQPSQIAK